MKWHLEVKIFFLNLFLLDLTGSQDGSVHIWEWGHPQTVAEPRAAGTFAKVTRVRFSQHGNKFGVADGDGNLSLFNVGLTSANYRPFYVSLDCCYKFLYLYRKMCTTVMSILSIHYYGYRKYF